MSNELKRSSTQLFFQDQTIAEGIPELQSEEFYTGNYNTLKLYVNAVPIATPDPLCFDVILIDPILLTEHSAVKGTQYSVTEAEANANGYFCVELRCNANYKARLRISTPTILAPNEWIIAVTGFLIEETSAPTTSY